MRTEKEVQLLRFAQNALLGEVAPSFRAVSFELSADAKALHARFIFDGVPSDDAKEVASVVMTNLLANYSENHEIYKEELLAIPYPKQMKHLPLLVYLRNEDDWNSWAKFYNSN